MLTTRRKYVYKLTIDDFQKKRSEDEIFKGALWGPWGVLRGSWGRPGRSWGAFWGSRGDLED